ncbi:ATP synthase subunit c [archaeon HR06]|nr:ATP synthase subunit c [archaeon HR06]
MNKKLILSMVVLALMGMINPVFAQGEQMKFLGAGLAFLGGAIGAGIAVGRAGAAGLAAAAEKGEMRSFALLITALGEAIAIYGIVVAIILLTL